MNSAERTTTKRTALPRSERRERLLEYVRDHGPLLLRAVVEWGVSEGLATESTLYEDLNWLVDAHRLERFPGEGGDWLALPGAMPLALPSIVAERCRIAMDKQKEPVLRIAAIADLLSLARFQDVLPAEPLLKLFDAATEDPEFPNRGIVFEVLAAVARRVADNVVAHKAPVDWSRALFDLRDSVGQGLVQLIGRDLAQAAWAARVLADLWRGQPNEGIAKALVEAALDPHHPMPSFEIALRPLADFLVQCLKVDRDADEATIRLRRGLRLRLDWALNLQGAEAFPEESLKESYQDRAQRLKNELRGMLL